MTGSTATTRYELDPAPGTLLLVQELANTIGVGTMPDLLVSTDSTAGWFSSITGAPAPAIDVASVERLRQLRGAVRSALGDVPAEPAGSLDLTLHLRVGNEGVAVLDDGFDVVQAAVTVGLIEGGATGALSRLKLCANPDCRIAFFDQSKNSAGKWHSATRCGNAARVRAHRRSVGDGTSGTGP